MKEWNDEIEGVTLGPEEALEREIAKSKALKVERLQLRDRVETLEKQVRALSEQCDELRLKLRAGNRQTNATDEKASPTQTRSIPARWAVFLLLFNLAALGGLLIYFGRHG